MAGFNRFHCLPEKYLRNNEADEIECTFLKKFQNTESYSILLTHMSLIGGLYPSDQG